MHAYDGKCLANYGQEQRVRLLGGSVGGRAPHCGPHGGPVGAGVAPPQPPLRGPALLHAHASCLRVLPRRQLPQGRTRLVPGGQAAYCTGDVAAGQKTAVSLLTGCDHTFVSGKGSGLVVLHMQGHAYRGVSRTSLNVTKRRKFYASTILEYRYPYFTMA